MKIWRAFSRIGCCRKNEINLYFTNAAAAGKEPLTSEKLLQQGKDLVRKTIKKARKIEP